MTEGRHHRRRVDDHTEDGIYFPPPREVPRSRTTPQVRPVTPSPWAPTAPDRPAPEIPPAPPPAAPTPARQSPPRPPGGDAHPAEAPAYYARASSWTVRPSPWATAEDDELTDEDTFAPAEAEPPPPPARKTQETRKPAQGEQDERDEDERDEQAPRRTAQPQPAVPARLPAEPAPSSATAWWIAAGVIVVALAVAAGILVGLNLGRRGSVSGAAPAPPTGQIATAPTHVLS
ncbi:hypothetical protein [Dactylosporangium sp. NPDC005555]|uniref:hypothetical protein n=1 Tax=Dactylosporangium sp. NPDC005555 TaxID=3154889 RepID=UPI0033B94950